MVELSWQSALVRAAAATAVLALLLLCGAAAALAASPKGPGAEGPTALRTFAAVLVCASCTALMLLLAGVLKEREALGERAPALPGRCRCLLGLLLLLLFVAPVLHLGFALGAAALGLGALLLVPGLGPQLRAAAACDALLSLAVAEATRRAGPVDGFRVAFWLLGLQAAGPAALLPGLAVLASVTRLPRLARLAGAGYAVAAAQAAAVALWGLGALVAGGIEAGGGARGGAGCLRSVAESPAGATLGFFRGLVEAEPHPGLQPDPCAGAGVRAGAGVAQCDTVGALALVFFVLAGLYPVAWAVALAACPLEPRVAPEGGAPPRGGCSALRRSWRQTAALAALALGAALLGVLGHLVLPCPEAAVPSAAGPGAAGNCTRPPAPAATAGCRCGEAGARGAEAVLSVPADQLATLWCELGLWAPACVGLLLYAYHALVCSLAFRRAAGHSERAEGVHRKPRSPTTRRPQPGPGEEAPADRAGPGPAPPAAPQPGPAEAAGAPPGGHEEAALAVFRPAPKEPVPLPSSEVGCLRLFAV